MSAQLVAWERKVLWQWQVISLALPLAVVFGVVWRLRVAPVAPAERAAPTPAFAPTAPLPRLPPGVVPAKPNHQAN